MKTRKHVKHAFIALGIASMAFAPVSVYAAEPGSSITTSTVDLSGVKIQLSQSSLLMNQAGQSAQLSATINNGSVTADNYKVIWLTSNAAIATVDSNGLVKGVREGTAVITAAIQSNENREIYQKATCQVTVGLHVEYSAHVKNIGWQSYVRDGNVAGTTGRSLQVEALKVRIPNTDRLTVNYSAHVKNVGWQSNRSNNAVAGTTGQSKHIEAVRMSLNGADKNKYDIYYAVHVANVGWLNWTKNGQTAGSTGYNLPIEAIKIKIQPKTSAAPARLSSANTGSLTTGISYSTHVQNIGWQKEASNGGTAGTTGRSLRLEALKIRLTNQTFNGNVQYRAHVQNIGWQSGWASKNGLSGTSGRALRLEAIQVKLTGDIAKYYNVYYRVHIQNIGWTGWASNGASCGSEGYAYRLEGMQIKVMPKGRTPGSTSRTFFVKPKQTIGEKIANLAKSKRGCWYQRGAAGPNRFDCSGLVSWALNNAGVKVGRKTSKDFAHMGKSVSRSQMKVGDVVTFGSPVHHVAIYVGNNQIVHAYKTGKPVEVTSLSGYWGGTIHNIRRLA